ncbi:PIN domain-containing protein [Achromobacter ruhlandii]|uniref:PIN domain-containing protein n=1 Tax=Achromobacter ruhlandii TaxID=72557 RepID=UPI0012FD0AFD|nr:PIN domain-containing protein [Achromobacter ruhlandii]
MIIFDANILIQLSTLPEDDDRYLRIQGLVVDLVASKTVIGIPAPAWAEYLCGADLATAGVIQALRRRRTVRVLPFDEAAAFELSFIHRGAVQFGSKRGAAAANVPWQQIKTDRQILAIARVHQASVIYTDDEQLSVEAQRLNVPVKSVEDIPLKPQQTKLDLSFDEPVEDGHE